MRKILWLLIVAAVGWIAYRTFFKRPPDELDEHLREQRALQEAGQSATAAGAASTPTVQQFDSRGIFDGVISDPFQSVQLPQGRNFVVYGF